MNRRSREPLPVTPSDTEGGASQPPSRKRPRPSTNLPVTNLNRTSSSNGPTTPIVLEDGSGIKRSKESAKFVVLANPAATATAEFEAVANNLHDLHRKFDAQAAEIALLRSAHEVYQHVAAQLFPAMQGLSDTVSLLQELPPRYLEDLSQMAKDKGEAVHAATIERLGGGHSLAANHLQVAFKAATLFKPQLDEVDNRVLRKD